MAKVRYTAYGCWEWRGSHYPNGYALFYDGRAITTGHRAAYELFKGPLEPSLEPDHLCRNRGCVHPDHLEAVTRSVNVRRGLGPQRTRERSGRQRCRAGHELAEENVYRYRRRGYDCRACRACRKIVSGDQSRKRKEARHGRQA